MAVGVSNFDTAYAMTAHLADKGYRKIAFVSTPIHGNDRLQQRCIGYRQAHGRSRPPRPAATWRSKCRSRRAAAPTRSRAITERDADGRRDLLLQRHARHRRRAGVPPPRLAHPGAARHRRLRQHGSRRRSCFRRSPPCMCRATRWDAARSPSCCSACRPDASSAEDRRRRLLRSSSATAPDLQPAPSLTLLHGIVTIAPA